jgi:hypothetical protein
MNILNWIRDNFFPTEEVVEEEYHQPAHRPDHDTLVYAYVEKYLNSLNPNHCYDVRETLKSGMIVTHKENVSLREAKDYVRMIWIASCPPNICVEVTTTR